MSLFPSSFCLLASKRVINARSGKYSKKKFKADKYKAYCIQDQINLQDKGLNSNKVGITHEDRDSQTQGKD